MELERHIIEMHSGQRYPGFGKLLKIYRGCMLIKSWAHIF